MLVPMVDESIAVPDRAETVRAEREKVSSVDGSLYPDLDGLREFLAKRRAEPPDAHK